MQKWLLSITVIATAALSGGGCSSIPQAEHKNEPIAQSASGKNLTAAFVRNDVKKFRSELPAELQKEFPAEKFQAIRKTLEKSLGIPVSSRFLTKIEHPLLNVEIWTIRFERTGEEGKIIHQEALFRVISGILDGKPQIISFNFL